MFAVLDMEIHLREYCQFTKLIRLKFFARYMWRQGVAAALCFNRHVFQSLIKAALYTSQ